MRVLAVLLIVVGICLGLLEALPVRKVYMTEEPVNNWGHTVPFGPQEFYQPTTEEEIVAKVREVGCRGGKIKVVGAGHSWMPVASTSDVLINLDRYNNTLRIDAQRLEVTVQAGVRLWDLNEHLWDAGYSLRNLGWSSRFTLAGVVSTGTHGTGRNDGVLAEQVVAFRLILANGTVITASRTHNVDIFNCRTSMGTLGILSTLTLSVLPRFNMFLDHIQLTRREFETTFYRDAQTLDNVEYWSVMTPGATAPGYWVKYVRYPTPIDEPITGCFRESEYTGSNCTDRSYISLTEEEDLLYAEMEMFVPVEKSPQVIKEFSDWQAEQAKQWVTDAAKERLYGTWSGLRWVKADEQWLSPAYHRDSVVVSFGLYYRQYADQDDVVKDLAFFELYARQLEIIAKKVHARPHWGKMHWFTHDELRSVYPRWNDFMRLRESLDPHKMFINTLEDRLFRPEAVARPPAHHQTEEGPENEFNFIFSGMIPARKH